MSETQETYIPTEEEKRRGNWAVVCERLDEDGDPDFSSTVHIIPVHGLVHEIALTCWCGPQVQHEDNGEMCIHKASQ